MGLTTSYVFDAAHRIAGHPGKCAWLHGHTYHLEVTVSSPTLNPLGMVMDFDDLRDAVGKAVLDLWDHATLLAADDPLGPAIAAVQLEAPDRVVRVTGPPVYRPSLCAFIAMPSAASWAVQPSDGIPASVASPRGAHPRPGPHGVWAASLATLPRTRRTPFGGGP